MRARLDPPRDLAAQFAEAFCESSCEILRPDWPGPGSPVHAFINAHFPNLTPEQHLRGMKIVMEILCADDAFNEVCERSGEVR